MGKCTICNSRKGKRNCLITLTYICSACCGKNRTDGQCKQCSFYQRPESERKSNKLLIEDDNQIKSLLAQDKIIQAVRLVVERTGWGLKKSKDYVLKNTTSSIKNPEEKLKAALTIFENDSKEPFPEVERFPIHFYEDGLTGLDGSLIMRETIALQHWNGNKDYSFYDLMQKIIPKMPPLKMK